MAGQLVEAPPVVTIVGVGLVGGSIGMACRRFGAAREVVGCDADPSVLDKAVALGAIDRALPFEEAVAAGDIVMLAPPVGVIPDLLRRASLSLRSGALLTDTGSTKKGIVASAARLPRTVAFLGGHPMAGAESAGVEASDPFLLQNAVYILTPTAETPEWALKVMRTLVVTIGAIPQFMAPDEHDRVVAAVSHLPHVTAVSLVNTTRRLLGDDRLLGYAAGGFRDTTRIAGGSPSLWLDILQANRERVAEAVEALIAELQETLAHLREEPEAAAPGLGEALTRARETRQLIPAWHKGLLAPVFEMVVHIEDRPGAIAGVAAALAGCGVNIRNIEIVRLREGVGGSLKVGVDSAEALSAGIGALRASGFAARPLG